MKTARLCRVLILVQVLTCCVAASATRSLTIHTNGSGTVSRNPTNSAYPEGASVMLTAAPAAGWVFAGWSGDYTGTGNPVNIVMDTDKVITANFGQIQTYVLEVNVSGAGSVDPSGGSYLSNSTVSVQAFPAAGWMFAGWSGDAVGTENPVNVTMTRNKALSALFVQPPTILSQPENSVQAPGLTATFQVVATGTGPLSYTWRFNGSALGAANASTLTIENVQPQNGGVYDVVVSNPYASVTSAAAVLAVTCPGTNVVSVPSDAALRAAVASGGYVRLCFSGAVVLTNTIIVERNTVLDGSGVSAVISGGHAVRLFTVNAGVALTISNLTLANGWRLGTNGSAGGEDGEPAAGGAIYNSGGSVSLVSCVLSNNLARGGDGASRDPNGAGGHAGGGAIFNAGGDLTVINSSFITNASRAGAGGSNQIDIFLPGFGNGGSASGGAIFNSGGTLSVINSLFAGNAAFAAAGNLSPRPIAQGGAIFQSGGFCLVSNATFSLNLAEGASAQGAGTQSFNSGASAAGGALGATGGVLVARFSKWHLNRAAGGDSFRFSGLGEASGGAVFNSAVMRILDSELVSNTAQPGRGGAGRGDASGRGGAILNWSALELNRSLLASNEVYGSSGYCVGDPWGSGGTPALGGAVCNRNGGTMAATNCTIAFNRAIGGNPCSQAVTAGEAYGGGVYEEAGSITLVHVTLASNQVSAAGGISGVPAAGANLAQTNGTTTVHASVIAYPGTNANVWGTILDGGYNICSDGSANFTSGSSFNFTDPKLLPLADNGGPTGTMALAPNSPAIDWGPTAGPPATDQRGVARPYGAGVDIGAYEWAPPAPVLAARRLSAGNVELSFQAVAALTYQLQWSTNLSSWSTVETIPPTNGTVFRSVLISEPVRFFRLQVQ